MSIENRYFTSDLSNLSYASLTFWMGMTSTSAGDVVFAAKVEHLLRFGDTADGEPERLSSAQDQAEGRNSERLFRCADQRKVAVTTE